MEIACTRCVTYYRNIINRNRLCHIESNGTGHFFRGIKGYTDKLAYIKTTVCQTVGIPNALAILLACRSYRSSVTVGNLQLFILKIIFT